MQVPFPLDPNTYIDHKGNRYFFITEEFRDEVCAWLSDREIPFRPLNQDSKRPDIIFERPSDYLLFKLAWEEIQ